MFEAEEKTKLRDLPPTGIRLYPEVKTALQREAAINGRSLHAEIILRLTKSLDEQKPAQGRALSGGSYVSESLADASSELPEAERSLVMAYRRLSPQKQLALLMLLK